MRKAIIIGGGPAGLTAAYELLKRTDIRPIIVEKEKQVGGLSRTINYKGNRIDIGGHRFFSKSEKVISWWLNILPLDESVKDHHLHIMFQNKFADFTINNTGNGEKIMLLRPRKSRIYYNKKFFDYPLTLNLATINKLGFFKMTSIAFSYLKSKLFPVRPEENLEQFFKNRLGKKLYETFFKDYTEKVWGISCDKIPSSWGSQRVKDLNISRVIKHAFLSVFRKNKSLDQKGTSTSLIEQFLYPKYGPGQMWETVAEEITKMGGEIHLNSTVTSLSGNNKMLQKAEFRNRVNGEPVSVEADYFFSTMPIRELMNCMNGLEIRDDIRQLAASLKYRDFLIVGILLSKLNISEKGKPIKDNWIYIQDKNVKAGRIQVFHNWSPYMVSDPEKAWIGVEYFCNDEDEFWKQKDPDIVSFAIEEMQKIGIADREHVLDSVVLKVEKAYPSYYGSYNQFNKIEEFLNQVHNLFPLGRNGMHRYNNTDHSMLTAMAAVDNIITGQQSKENIWRINTEDDYHEEV